MKTFVILLAILTAATAFQPAHAGTLCGTVRDAQTQLPVSNAGIFVFLNNSYTGMYAATDGAGVFCVDPIAPGTYDLQVKVNEHETTWVTNVVVDDTPSSVDIQTPSIAVLFAPWPNPASTQVSFRFRSPVEARVSLEVYDVAGRLVHAWGGRGSGNDTDVSWNLTDVTGRRMASGVYLVRLRAGDHVSTRKLVLTR